jgi:putative transposase
MNLTPILDASTRQAAYRELLKTSLEPADTDALRDHTRQNKAFGNDHRFRRRIGALIGRSMEIRARGRPKSSA